MKKLNLHSVCQSAHCPNRMECWAHGTATFMIMGEYCTRGCRFCAVRTMAHPPPLDPEEPDHLARAVSELNLRYIVITSVDRDDLPDYGAGHFAACVTAVRTMSPQTRIEVLIPDFQGNPSSLETLVKAKPDVVSHNLETVERLSPEIRDRRAGYRQSLGVLQMAKRIDQKMITKSGIMLGLGETKQEILQTMQDLRSAEVDILTIGQYLSPGKSHYPVKEYLPPAIFNEYKQIAYGLGFRYVASGPLVRSSYGAAEALRIIL